MAELTKQQSIKLLTTNRFRISPGSTARSRNFTNRSLQNTQTSVKSAQKLKTKSTSKYPENQNFKKALVKIGALQKEDLRFSFVPDEEDHQAFRSKRLSSLRAKYLHDRTSAQSSDPYNDELIDEAALGCWKYGECNSHTSIWKRYKQNLNKLNYETYRIVRKKGIY